MHHDGFLAEGGARRYEVDLRALLLNRPAGATSTREASIRMPASLLLRCRLRCHWLYIDCRNMSCAARLRGQIEAHAMECLPFLNCATCVSWHWPQVSGVGILAFARIRCGLVVGTVTGIAGNTRFVMLALPPVTDDVGG